MDYRRLIRDPEKVRSALRSAGDGTTVAVRGVKIVVPERYKDRGLMEVTAEVQLLGIFPVIVDDQYYAVSNVIAMTRLRPTTLSTVKIDGDNYLELWFEPGAVVVSDGQVVKNDSLIYKVFDEFIAKGRIPWFIDYRKDLAGLFDSTREFTTKNFGRNHVILEIIAASITRNEKDLTQYYRHSVRTLNDVARHPPTNIPLRSIAYGATNTTAKIVGSYFGDGLTAALVNPSERLERIEEILRK